jgi:hypothetical protein
MTKFQEICEAAKTARSDHFALRDNSWRALNEFLMGYKAYCEIPDDRIKLLKWNGAHGEESKYNREPEEGGIWSLMGATVFDEANELWVLGVVLTLTPNGTFPENWVSFAVCTTEIDGNTQMKIGFPGPVFPWNQDESSRHKFYDYINVELLKNLPKPRLGAGAATKSLGFQFGSNAVPDKRPEAGLFSK